MSRFLDERGNIVAEHNDPGPCQQTCITQLPEWRRHLLGYSAAYDPDAWIRPHAYPDHTATAGRRGGLHRNVATAERTAMTFGGQRVVDFRG